MRNIILILFFFLINKLTFCQDSTTATQSETIQWLNLQIAMRNFSDLDGYVTEIWPFHISSPDSLTFKVIKMAKASDGVYNIYQSNIVSIPLSMMDPKNIKIDQYGITLYATNNKKAIHVLYYSCRPNQSNQLEFDRYQSTYYFQINGKASSDLNGNFSTERLKNALVNLITLNGGKISDVKLQEEVDKEIKDKF